jgi:hypothetical protein
MELSARQLAQLENLRNIHKIMKSYETDKGTASTARLMYGNALAIIDTLLQPTTPPAPTFEPKFAWSDVTHDWEPIDKEGDDDQC